MYKHYMCIFYHLVILGPMKQLIAYILLGCLWFREWTEFGFIHSVWIYCYYLIYMCQRNNVSPSFWQVLLKPDRWIHVRLCSQYHKQFRMFILSARLFLIHLIGQKIRPRTFMNRCIIQEVTVTCSNANYYSKLEGFK